MTPQEAKQVILVEVDDSCEMAMVSINKECVMEGNFWDFHPGCHGITKYGDFNSYTELVQKIFLYLRKKGFEKIEIKKRKYKWK